MSIKIGMGISPMIKTKHGVCVVTLSKPGDMPVDFFDHPADAIITWNQVSIVDTTNIFFRYQDFDNYLYVQVHPTGQISLRKNIAGGDSLVGGTPIGTVEDGDEISITFTGSSIKCYVNSVEKIDGTVSQLTSLTVGYVDYSTSVVREFYVRQYSPACLAEVGI